MNFLQIKEAVTNEIKRIMDECGEDTYIYDETTIMPDSITYIQLIVSLEELFCIEFSEEYLDYTLCENIDDLVAIIEKMVNYNTEGIECK